MQSRKIKFLFLTILILINLCMGIVSANDLVASRQKNHVLNVGISPIPAELDPTKLWSFQQFMIVQCVFQTLVRVNKDDSLEGDLAEKWQITDNGKTFTFFLNPNAKFQNGAPVLASDVAWSFSRHLWVNSGSFIASHFARLLEGGAINLPYGKIISGIQIIDPHTIRFHLNKPYPPFLYVISMPAFSILPQKDFNGLKPVGSGPMEVRYDPVQPAWILTAYKKYTGSPAKMHQIIVTRLSTVHEIETAISKEQIDLVLSSPAGDAFNIKLPSQFHLLKLSSLSFTHFFFNLDNDIFKDQTVREKFSFLIQKIFERKSDTNSLHEFNPHFLPRAVLPFAYYTKTQNMNSIQQTGANFRFSRPIIILLREDYFSQQMIQEMKKSLHNAGIKVIWHYSTREDFVTDLHKSQYDLVLGGYYGDFADPDGYIEPLRKESPIRYGHIPTDELLNELDKIRYMGNAAQRLSRYARAFEKFEKHYYIIPLFQVSQSLIAHKELLTPDFKYRDRIELWKITWDR